MNRSCRESDSGARSRHGIIIPYRSKSEGIDMGATLPWFEDQPILTTRSLIILVRRDSNVFECFSSKQDLKPAYL